MKKTYFPSLCFLCMADSFKWARLSASPCLVFAKARLNDNVHSQHNNLPSTYERKLLPTIKNFESHYLFIIVLSIKRTLLFALFAIHGWSILDFRVGASLAFVADKCGDNVTVLAGRWFSIRLHVLFALFANRARVTFWRLLEFWSTICAFYHRKRTSTFLIVERKISVP